MNDHLSKAQLLELLKSRQAAWSALVASIDEAHMDIPGAVGHWSVKDIVSHITAYERWLVEWLTSASQNTFPAPSPLDDADIERRNTRIYELTRGLPLQKVMDDAQKNFEALLAIIEVLSDEYFGNPQSAEWFMQPYWSKMKTVPAAVINLSVDHYDEHIPSIKAWIDKEIA